MSAAPFELKCNACDYINSEVCNMEIKCSNCGKGIMVKRE